MAKQQVVLVDRNDRKLGAEEKLKAHQKNLKHRAFSVFIFNNRNQLLLQQRNRNKYHAGGLWSNTCCSHPAPGEKTAKAAKRRLKEEIGISCSLKEIFSFNYQTKLGEIFENEFDHVFVGRYNSQPKPDPEEVKDWQWIDLDKLNQNIKKNPGKFTYWFKFIIEKYWDEIEKALEKEAYPFYKFTVRYNPMRGKKLKEVHFFVPSGGCQKAKETGPCTMCVFYEPWKLLDAPARKPTPKEITNLYNQHVFPLILSTSAELLRLDGGGSFINENEFPVSALCTIFKKFLPKTIRIVEIESRPEFVTDKVLRQLKNVLPKGVNLLVHMGIETGSEVYRNQLLNKNTTDKEITTAVKKLQKYGFKSGAYLLAGLPKLTREQSIADAIESIRFCSQIGFDSIVLCPTVVPDLNSKLGDLYKKKQFFPLQYRDIINVVDATKNCPVVLAFDDDPPAAVGISGNLADKEKLNYFRENHILESIKSESSKSSDKMIAFSNLLPSFFPNCEKTDIFSDGMLPILRKALGSIFGDIKECAKFYGMKDQAFEKLAVPLLTQIQILVYFADFAIENLENEKEAVNCNRVMFDSIKKLVAANGIKNKKIAILFDEVYDFLAIDRKVRQEKLSLPKKDILRTLHYKVSDLVALMRIACESGRINVPENEWQIWRQFELIREFIDDQEDRDEDIKEDAEQFNSIVQMERQGIKVKEVIGQECQKLEKMINKVRDKDRKIRFLKIYHPLVKKEIPRELGFKEL